MKLHPTQFREVYGRLSYMTKASWNEKLHPVIGGKDVVTVLAGPPGEFAGSFIVQDFARVMASLWEVPLETIYEDGYSYSTLYDMQTDRPNVASDHDVIFTAPHAHTGLWPARQVDLNVPGMHPAVDTEREG